MPSRFKFKEYCPVVFRNLRERFDIDDEMFAVSKITECVCGRCIKSFDPCRVLFRGELSINQAIL